MEKQIHPDAGDGYTKPARESRGRYNMKFLLGGAAVIALIAGSIYVASGFKNERANKEEPKGLSPATMTAKAQAAEPTAQAEQPKTDQPATNTEPTRGRQKAGNSTATATQATRERKQKPKRDEFIVSTLAFGNKYMSNTINPLLNGARAAQAEEQPANSGGSQGRQSGPRGSQSGHGGAPGFVEQDEGYEGAAAAHSRSRASKNDFYTNGGGRSASGLYHPYTIQSNLKGCVLKAGEEILVESRNPVRTDLPGSVRGWIAEPAWGFIYHEDGSQEECEAIPAGSQTMLEVNASVSRGDVRVQMCAKQISLPGGIMPMDCSPVLGQDGASGVEAEADYQWGGVIAGIVIEAGLASAQSLTGLIEGPAGVAVNIGMQGIQGAGARYVDRELNRPPVLFINKGAIYKIQVNSDISFPVR